MRTEVELALGPVEDGMCLDREITWGGLLGGKLAPTQVILLRKDPHSLFHLISPTVTVLRAPAQCQAFAQDIAFNLPNNPKW